VFLRAGRTARSLQCDRRRGTRAPAVDRSGRRATKVEVSAIAELAFATIIKWIDLALATRTWRWQPSVEEYAYLLVRMNDLGCELVAAIAYGLEHLGCSAVRKLPSQPTDEDIDRAVEHVAIAALRQIEQLIA
jgi:hypothetical protein